MMSETIDEATSEQPSPKIVDSCRRTELKRLLSAPHAVEEGTVEIQGKKRRYKFAKPLPRNEAYGDDAPYPAVVQFAGVLEIEGKAPMPYSISRFNRDGGWTESFISVNGAKGHVIRDPLPQDVTYEGTVEVQVPSPFSYKVKQTLRRGETALERDELEGIITASAAP